MAFTITPQPRPAETVEPPVREQPIPATPEQATVTPAAEIMPTPEVQEKQAEQERAAADRAAAEAIKAAAMTPSTPKVETAESEKNEVEKKIDKILEADLQDIYRSLPEKVRPEFKVRGEHASRTLKSLIESAKATALQVAEILREWLKLIPSNGAYFAEQLVKIKTDQLMMLAKSISHGII